MWWVNAAWLARRGSAVLNTNEKGCDEKIGKLLYHLATNATGKSNDATLSLIARYIAAGKIDKVRIGAATKLAVAAGQRGTSNFVIGRLSCREYFRPLTALRRVTFCCARTRLQL